MPKRKTTIEDMRNLAKSKGGKCLSQEYKSSRTKLEWECEKGHRWFATPASINHGHWCRKCAYDRRRCTLEEMQQMAKERGGNCLSEEYSNMTTKLEWECENGHRWFASPINIKQGSWCRECVKKNKELIFLKSQEIARSKGGKCLSKEFTNLSTKLEWECKKRHTWFATPSRIIKGHWCGKCAYDRKKCTIEEMQEIAESKGGKCISKEYINIATKLEWECEKGHRWFATPINIKQGSWCKECIRQNKKLILKKLQEIAESKGGKCMAKEYKNVTMKLEWECKKSHRWFAPPSSIKKGSWCPKCFLERRKKVKIT